MISTEFCDNINGTCICKTGWMGDDCEIDVNECENNSSLCQDNSSCRNTNGSFLCVCNDGFNLRSDGIKSCEECDDGFYGQSCALRCECGQHQLCDKVNGSCFCVTGWQGNNCEQDVNECTDHTHNCNVSLNEECENIPGGFKCKCSAGFGRMNEHSDCQDIDLCKGSNCEWGCIEFNSNTSIKCLCQAGKHLDSDDISCKDCSTWKHGIDCIEDCQCLVSNSASCDKVDGTCVCSNGWKGDNCSVDIDECIDSSSSCQKNSHCINTQGSFHCECDDGFWSSEKVATVCKGNKVCSFFFKVYLHC